MPGFSVLIKNTQLIAQEGIPLWKFDGRISENIEHSNAISSHPVEKGSQNDHIQPQNPTITMSGIVSNSHIGSGLEFLDNSENRLVKQYETLAWICEAGLRFDLITRLKVFEDVVISNVTFLQDRPSDSMKIDITFKKLLIADTQQVLIPSDILARKNRKGKQALSNADWCAEQAYRDKIREKFYNQEDANGTPRALGLKSVPFAPGCPIDPNSNPKASDNKIAILSSITGLKGKKGEKLKNARDALTSLGDTLIPARIP